MIRCAQFYIGRNSSPVTVADLTGVLLLHQDRNLHQNLNLNCKVDFQQTSLQHA